MLSMMLVMLMFRYGMRRIVREAQYRRRGSFQGLDRVLLTRVRFGYFALAVALA